MYLWVNLTYLKRPEFYILDLFLSNTPVSHQKIQIIIAKRQNKNLIYRADKNQAHFQKQIKYRKTNKKIGVINILKLLNVNLCDFLQL